MSLYQLDLMGVPPSKRLAEERTEADADTPPPGGTDEWFTLEEDFEPLNREFHFNLDAFASHEPGGAKCGRYFTRAEDGLVQSWEGARVWDNPPYSDLPRCTTKARNEILRAHLVVQLLPAWTDRRWFHANVEPFRTAGLCEVRFLPGRLRFGWPGRPQGSSRTCSFPSMLVVFRSSTALRDEVRRILEREAAGLSLPLEEGAQ